MTTHSGYAPPFSWGSKSVSHMAVCESDDQVLMCYKIKPHGNAGTVIDCEARGYKKDGDKWKEEWKSIGAGGEEIRKCIPWGNVISYPACRCYGSPFGAVYSWSFDTIDGKKYYEWKNKK